MNDGYRLVTRKIGLFVSSVGLALLVTSSPTKGPMPGIPGSHERLMHRALGWPDHRPWLGAYVRESCGGTGAAQASRLLVRSASNAYFAQTMSVISMPRAWRRDSRSGRRGLDRIPPVLRVEGRCDPRERIRNHVVRAPRTHDALARR